MEAQDDNSNLQINIACEEDLIDLKLCAKEYIEFINDFDAKFLNENFFILTAYYNQILAGFLVAEDMSLKVNSLEGIIPSMCIYLIYVNPQFRNRNIGKSLLLNFLNIQKENGIALIHVKLPHKYKKGIKFFLKNNFYQSNKIGSEILLECKLWKDYGLRECHIIDENINDNYI